MSFPALKNTKEFSSSSNHYYGYSGEVLNPAVPTTNMSTVNNSVMTVDGTVRRTALSFAVMLAGAAVGMFFPILMIPAVLVGLVLGLVIAFKRVTNSAATLSYSAVQGVVIGGISMVMEQLYPGIVSQAVLATLSVFAVILFFTAKGIFRTTPFLNRVFIVAGFGYLLFGLINLGLMLTGVTESMFGLYSDMGSWGFIIGILGTLLASYSLVTDVEFVKNGVANQIESRWEWFAAFSLIGTLVWLYLEILRLFALSRN